MAQRTCSIDGCEKITGISGTARGLCNTHYRRLMVYGDPMASKKPERRFCSIEGCEGPAFGHGWCQKHYARWRRNGDPLNAGDRASIRPSGLRRCSTCRQEKPPEDFYDVPESSRRKYRCKECQRADARSRGVDAAHRRRARLAELDSEQFSPSEIFERDGWVCQLCGRKINRRRKWPDPLSASIDHILPISLGGGHLRANAQASHLRCNLRKHTGGTDQLRLIG